MKTVVTKMLPGFLFSSGLCVAGLVGCDSSGNDQKQQATKAQSDQQYQREVQEFEERSRRGDAMDSRYEALLTIWEEQARRADEMDARHAKLLTSWEAQSQRVNALLDGFPNAVESRPAEE